MIHVVEKDCRVSNSSNDFAPAAGDWSPGDSSDSDEKLSDEEELEVDCREAEIRQCINDERVNWGDDENWEKEYEKDLAAPFNVTEVPKGVGDDDLSCNDEQDLLSEVGFGLLECFGDENLEECDMAHCEVNVLSGVRKRAKIKEEKFLTDWDLDLGQWIWICIWT